MQEDIRRSTFKESYETQCGVRQGDTLSPLLFIMVLNLALRRMTSKRVPVDNKVLRYLAYADDITIPATNLADLKEAVVQPHQECQGFQRCQGDQAGLGGPDCMEWCILPYTNPTVNTRNSRDAIKFSQIFLQIHGWQPSKRGIRHDIQCLRALAIFGVLGFHIWPQVFPLGYLGVDVFFVISGYLMTLILSRSSAKGLTFLLLLDFYNRRAKRILPPYVLTIFVTLLVCQFVLTRSDLMDLKEDAIWALGIATNIGTIWKKQQYFDSIHLYNFLLHTWSLGLEMQYYVFAPMVLWAVAKFPRPLLLNGLISCASFAAQCLVSDDAVSFSFIGCRLWQFMIGTAAFYVSKTPGNGYTLLIDAESQSEEKREANPIRKKLWYTLTVVSLSLLILLPYADETIVKNTSIASRLLSTLLAGVTIASGANATILLPVPSQLSNVLHYVGDISYSVYLVHWPLVILIKYLNIFTPYYTIALIIVTFALGITQYTLFEKPLSKQPAKHIYAVIFLLNIACIAILHNQSAIRDMFADPENYLEKNGNLLAQCKEKYDAQHSCKKSNLPWLGNRQFEGFLCEFEGTGSLTVLWTGNSFASFFYPSLVEAGKHKFKKLILTAAPGCMVHPKIPYDHGGCTDVTDNLPRTLADVKPDIVIVNQRYWSTRDFKNPPTDPQNDPVVDAMREDWAMISNYTKKIIIVEPSAGLDTTPSEVATRDLLKPFRLNATDFSAYAKPLKDYKADVDPGWDRVLKSVDKCLKCKLVGIRSHFCDSKSCAVYDTKRRISLYCDISHHAPTAIKRYLPSILREIEL
uniref:Acyl_transf_3 domain-containing protein n=2 Tax=Panagrellus redivivus TaxID=6233 RepID=A0A7E4W0D8_PANRE